MTRTNVPH